MSRLAIRLAPVTVVLAGLVLAPAALGDLDHSIAMTTPQALAADGSISTPCTTACAMPAPDPSQTYPAQYFQIGAAFVDPGPDATALGPASGGLDMSRPYAELQITHWADASNPTTCTAKLNPTSYGEDTTGIGPGPIAQVWFDAPCDDGLGYDYYRVHLTQAPSSVYPAPQQGPCIEQNTD